MDKYRVIQFRYVTEKAKMLEKLQHATSNACVSKCSKAKYVFVVDPQANKPDIAKAVEDIYADQKIKVTSVNIVNVKPKKRRVRGRVGLTKSFKKAIVTLVSGDQLEEV